MTRATADQRPRPIPDPIPGATDRGKAAKPGDRRLLRLKGVDAEDIAIISAQVQDAIVPVADMAYLSRERVFAMVVNRFMWEAGPVEPSGVEEAGRDGPICPLYLRTNCGIEFRQVSRVQSRGLDLRDRSQLLCLLAICAEEDGVDLHFSGGGVVRLAVDAIDCRVRDMDEPWPTQCRPAHPVDQDKARS